MKNVRFGLLGEKLGHSISPAIHKLIFEELGLDEKYKLFEVKNTDLNEAILGFKESGIKGINVTIPYKIEAMKYLDEISTEAAKISAVNTIFFEDGKLKGYNTDYYGFGMLLEKNKIEIEGKIAVVLGSGGASKAVIQYLMDHGAKEIIVVSRDVSNMKNVFIGCKTISYAELKKFKSGDIIINCTPVGMYPNIDESPVEIDLINIFSSAVELIYNPKETMFLKYASKIGIKTVNGLYMLVGQAVKSQEIWNDIEINNDMIDKIFNKIKELI